MFYRVQILKSSSKVNLNIIFISRILYETYLNKFFTYIIREDATQTSE